MTDIKRFVDYQKGDYPTKYNAGYITERYGDFLIAESQKGAEETFSIGQPVYDIENNLMGYLGIGLYANLDYATEIRIPVEYWKICLPTKYCITGKSVYTYWQNKAHVEPQESEVEE